MKKIIKILLSVLILVLIFSACSTERDETNNKSHNEVKQNLTEDPINQNSVNTNTDFEIEAEATNKLLKLDADNNSNLQTSSVENAESTSDNIWFFESTDFAGKAFNSQEFFADSKLTLVNVWATWCPPCRAELPDLGKLAKDFADQEVQFLGIATDVVEGEQDVPDIANNLLSDSGVEYLNVKYNVQTENIMLQNQIQSLPTTILLDENGDMIGDFIIGMRNYDEFSSLINSALDLIE